MNKERIMAHIESKASDFYDVSDKVWDAAETAFEEYKSTDILCAALEKEGFEVKRGVAGIDTAFTGRFGSGKPVIGILGEFDALSGISQEAGILQRKALTEGGNGHGCGHNMLGAGSLAAAVGIKKYIEETTCQGTVIYFGCPGEEGGSGKTFMAREGVFDELDFALSWHPGTNNAVWSGSTLANYQVSYRFKGISAHAAADPHNGRSALDAVELMNVGIQFLREHIIPEARVHYAITNTGGYSPNVVQPNAEVLYLIRAPKTPQVDEIYKRVTKVAEGAAHMTETELEIDFVKACSNIVTNNVMEEVLYENMKSIPLPEYTTEELAFVKSFADTAKQDTAMVKAMLKKATYLSDSEKAEITEKLDNPLSDFIVPYIPSDTSMPGSTDVGDVSWICPTSQISTATWAAGTPAHSWQIVSQGKGAAAHKGLLHAGKVLAAAAIDLLNKPELVEKAKEELAWRLEGGKYVCPIPESTMPRRLS